ncbi:ABC transporter substrate-binding protein [Compostimonas suwonensis]|uniref:ABC transporter substrate-binding protein n=1 Tax=Compostimonas suwonensis TaxID=1048394 RepID=UPI000C24DF3A|nr:ABC transporter substrate-binding protein [Compostimonas suwonensis]
MAVGGLAACSSPGDGGGGGSTDGGLQTVTVLESSPGFFDLPIHVAMDDFDEQFGLNIDLTQVQGGGAAGQQFQGGTGDIAVTAADIPLRIQMQDSIPGGISIIGSNQFTMLYVMVAPADSDIDSMDDLVGKKVGITGPKSSSELVTRWAMSTKFGMNPEDTEFVALGSVPTILEGIRNGSVDAGILFSPALEQGLGDGSVKVVFDFRDFPNGQNVFYARNNDIEKDGSKFSSYMKAYTAAVEKMESDPDYAFAAAKKYYGTGLSDDVLHQILDFYLEKEWSETEFTQASYDASKDMLLNSSSGFEEATFPSYEEITKGAPTS